MSDLKRYPKLRYPGEEDTRGLFADGEVYIQEKLDGSNFRFTYDGAFTFGSRNTAGENLHTEQFEAAIEYIRETADAETLDSIQADRGPLVFFGEAMNPHTISYEWEQTPEFIGFDVWAGEDEVFLHPDDAQGIFDALGLSVAPIVDTVPAEQWGVYDFEVPQSAFYDGLAEGVVFKNPTTGTYGKFVRDEFKEKNKETFGASKKTDLSETELTVEEYVPPARIRSVAHQLVDDGEWDSLQMEMMEDLPAAAIRDMAAEEAGELFMTESRTLDLGAFRSQVSGRCASVLRQMLDEKARAELRGDVE